MRVYTVHENPAYGDERRIVLVKEGFCWPAFFFTIVWAIYRRVWLGLGVYLIGLVVLATLEAIFASNQVTIFALNIAFAAYVAAEANEWRRRSMAKRGYTEVSVVIGETLDDAERRYFEKEFEARAKTGSPTPPAMELAEPAGAL